MKLFYTRQNILRGALIYAAGDSIAAFITNEFSLYRLIGILFLGGVVYAFEIPNYLAWLEEKFPSKNFKIKLLAGILFTLYFNPLWIARHILILDLFRGNFAGINWQLLDTGWKSFLYSIWFVLPLNYVISNIIPYKWRFTASGIFSGLMAVYYALSAVMFK